MQDIPEAEARALLARPLLCEDSPGWEPVRTNPDSVIIGVGAVDLAGRSAGMYAQLIYTNSPKTRVKKYKFTLFRRQPFALERVYELQVNIFNKPMHDAHQKSHEHIGRLRVTGGANWTAWRYDDVVAYFCSQTNITFNPHLPDPEHFQLKG